MFLKASKTRVRCRSVGMAMFKVSFMLIGPIGRVLWTPGTGMGTTATIGREWLVVVEVV